MNLRLRNDVLLVLLPPDADAVTPSGLILTPAFTPPVTHGIVRDVGPKVQDVRPGDHVAFPPTEGDPITVDGHRHLFLRESAITGILQKAEASV